jgi:hypothetical protein
LTLQVAAGRLAHLLRVVACVAVEERERGTRRKKTDEFEDE